MDMTQFHKSMRRLQRYITPARRRAAPIHESQRACFSSDGNGKITVTAHHTHPPMFAYFEIEGQGQGTVTISPGRLRDLPSSGQGTFSISPDALTVTVNGKDTVLASEGSTFPSLPTVQGKPFRIRLDFISKIGFAVNRQDRLYSNIHIHRRNGAYYAVASDRFRLAETEIEADGIDELLLPAAALAKIGNIGYVAGVKGDSWVKLTSPRGTTVMVYLDLVGSYPYYYVLFKDTALSAVCVNRDDLINAVKTTAWSPAEPVVLTTDPCRLTVRAETSQTTIDCTCTVDVKLSSRYLLDALAHSAEKVLICVKASAVEVTSPSGVRHLIAPLPS